MKSFKINANLQPFSTSTTDIPTYDNMLRKPEYFKESKGLIGNIEWMSPNEYLNKAADALGISFENFISIVDNKSIEYYKNKIQKGDTIPMPVVDFSYKGQEGRHRAIAAKELGIKSIPIFVVEPVERKSFTVSSSIKKEAGIKDVITKSYDWIKDKLKSEKSTEIEIRKDLEDQVEQSVEKDKEVPEDKSTIKKLIDQIVEKLKSEDSALIVEPEEVDVDEDEDVDDREEDLLDEDSMMDMIRKAADSKTLLWIRYRDQEGNETEREVEPWELRDDYYMFAHDPDFTPWHGSDIGTRQFILAAILDMHGTENPYKNPSRWEMRI